VHPDWVLAAASSLDRNLNGCGYCQSPACGGGECTVDSQTFCVPPGTVIIVP
jgi:hypothetical protein